MLSKLRSTAVFTLGLNVHSSSSFSSFAFQDDTYSVPRRLAALNSRLYTLYPPSSTLTRLEVPSFRFVAIFGWKVQSRSSDACFSSFLRYLLSKIYLPF